MRLIHCEQHRAHRRIRAEGRQAETCPCRTGGLHRLACLPRYTWRRDAAPTLSALLGRGRREADGRRRWLLRAVGRRPLIPHRSDALLPSQSPFRTARILQSRGWPRTFVMVRRRSLWTIRRSAAERGQTSGPSVFSGGRRVPQLRAGRAVAETGHLLVSRVGQLGQGQAGGGDVVGGGVRVRVARCEQGRNAPPCAAGAMVDESHRRTVAVGPFRVGAASSLPE
jgi:hypothetical protein